MEPKRFRGSDPIGTIVHPGRFLTVCLLYLGALGISQLASVVWVSVGAAFA